MPTLGARLARLTTAPDLLLTDGEAYLLADAAAATDAAAIEGWLPFGRGFDMLAPGPRHVMLGARQSDALGSQNISSTGDSSRPSAQLLGVRVAPAGPANRAA